MCIRDRSWLALSSGTTYCLNSVFFNDVNTEYAIGDNGSFLNTSNGGKTWTDLWIGNSYDMESIYFTDFNTGYIVRRHGSILKTIDGGSTWSDFSLLTEIEVKKLVIQ